MTRKDTFVPVGRSGRSGASRIMTLDRRARSLRLSLLRKELTMRSLAALLSVALLSSSAIAEPSSTIDLSRVPRQCRAVAEMPRSAKLVEPALSARVSTASCLAEVTLPRVPATEKEASIQSLDAAAAPIIALLDEVIAHGNPETQVVAEYTKGDLLLGLETRLRESIPPITPATSVASATEIERRHRRLEPKLARWNTDATNAFQRITELARENPKLANENPVLGYMVHEAELATR